MKIIFNFVLAATLLVVVSTSVFSAEAILIETGMVHANMLDISPNLPDEYNGIKAKEWAKTNSDYNKAKGKGNRIAGKVVGFEYTGEAYPVAVFRGGKKVSVFWLEKMKTQRD